MHKINDMVVYGSEGICRIADIVVQTMHGGAMEYYVLKPLGDGTSTIFVPTGNEALTAKMRRILSATEICDLIRSVETEESEWIEKENERKQRYRQILSDGDRRALLCMVKTVSVYGEKRKKAGKKLHQCDERFLKDAEKLVCEEFALALNIPKDEVVPFIMEQVSIAEKQ